MSKTVLVVEDNEMNIRLFRQIINYLGCAMIVAKDGQHGVRMAKEAMPDLILMDIQMPLMDGSEALRILKADAATENIPVVALTSYAMSGDRESFLNQGFSAYISKPIDVKIFSDTITLMLER